MPAPHASASFGSSKKSDPTTRSVGGTRAAGMRGVKTSASGGGRVKKAGRVLIFFTHFPLETPFLKAAVRPRSLRLSPSLTAEPRSLPHCWRWPPFTDPQPRQCVHIIRYFGLLFFFSRARFKKKQLFSARLSETHRRERQIHADILQLHVFRWGCTALSDASLHRQRLSILYAHMRGCPPTPPTILESAYCSVCSPIWIHSFACQQMAQWF